MKLYNMHHFYFIATLIKCIIIMMKIYLLFIDIVNTLVVARGGGWETGKMRELKDRGS